MVQIAPAAQSRAADSSQPGTDIDQLGDHIAEIAAHLHAATYQLLTLLREFDEREGWSGSGFLSCAHWLSWRTGIGGGAAREKVRVARALAALPNIGDAMRRGRLSFAKVRAITRVATPETEAQLLEVACTATAAQLQTIVRAWRRVDRVEELEQERDRHARRHLSILVDEDGSYVVRGRLDPEVGAVLMRAMEAGERGMMGPGVVPVEGQPDSEPPTAPQRRADAIGLVAEAALRNGIDDRAVAHRADRVRMRRATKRRVSFAAAASPQPAARPSGWRPARPHVYLRQRAAHGRPSVRVKGRTHPYQPNWPVTTPDFQPENADPGNVEGRVFPWLAPSFPHVRPSSTSGNSRRKDCASCATPIPQRNWPMRSSPWRASTDSRPGGR